MGALRFSLPEILFGGIGFAEGEEYRRFQYRFTCSILLFSIIITAIFHMAVHYGHARFEPTYLTVSRLYLLISILSYILLRGKPQRLMTIAGSYAVISCLLHVATLFLNTPDELRIIWFVLNLPGIYLVLGSVVGVSVTILSMVFMVLANPYLPTPYSPSAVITCVLGIAYLGAFFHAFSARSISFHHSMVEANRKLADMAAKDPLTGLYNARAYYACCNGALLRAQRSRTLFAMLFVDLDHFKRINDTHGHEAGDTVLKEVSATLLAGMRQSDLIGRIGGEEFSAFLPDTDLDGARALAEKLRQDIEALMPDIGSTRLRITASIGVAAGGPHIQAITAIQSQADQAMYVAKREGRNRVTCIDNVAVPA